MSLLTYLNSTKEVITVTVFVSPKGGVGATSVALNREAKASPTQPK